MSDDVKALTRSETLPTVFPTEPTPKATPSIHAIHTDKLWDADKLPNGELQNLGPTPVKVETKAEFFALLNARGLRMKDQAESTTGPELDPKPEPAPPVRPVPAPLTQADAELIHAMTAVLATYRLVETLWCEVCDEWNDSHGCRIVADHRTVRIECRCGVREYRGPKGTTDLPVALPKMTTTDQTLGTLTDPHGAPTVKPTYLLTAADAAIVRLYARWLEGRRLQVRRFCRDCWNRRMSDETVIHELVTPAQAVLTCACAIRFYQGQAF